MKNAKYANLDFSWLKLLLVLIQYVSLQRWNVIPAALETVVPVYIRLLIYLSMISISNPNATALQLIDSSQRTRFFFFTLNSQYVYLIQNRRYSFR